MTNLILHGILKAIEFNAHVLLARSEYYTAASATGAFSKL
jgi:hypothetical protein